MISGRLGTVISSDPLDRRVDNCSGSKGLQVNIADLLIGPINMILAPQKSGSLLSVDFSVTPPFQFVNFKVISLVPHLFI